MSKKQSTAKTTPSMAIEQISIAKTFGIDAPPQATTIRLPDVGSPYVPTPTENYVFRKEYVRDINCFLIRPHGDAMWITGPTGSGKTSLVLEMAARMNWPVQQVTCNGSMEFSELRGQFVVKSRGPGMQPEMTYQYGPLAKAMRFGHILILNEVDLVDPAELAGLNDVLEGRPLIIAENGGQIIKPHPNFRVICTANSAGQGDASGLYNGIQSQNLAAMDRYRVICVDYPENKIEEEIIAKVARDIAPVLRSGMVKLANNIRAAFMGKDGTPGSLSVTMSTRTLVRWAQLMQDYRGSNNAMRYTLSRALLNRCSHDEQVAINDMACVVFGKTTWEAKASDK